MRLAGIAFTYRGARLLAELFAKLKAEGEETEGAVLSAAFKDREGGCEKKGETLPKDLFLLSESLGSWTERQFREKDGIFFIGAAGIAVRACAPFLKDKTKDPAVSVIDERGTFAISLLSGHLGGANELTKRAAALIGALPVITTATDRNGLFSPDVFAQKNGLEIEDMSLAKEAAAALLRGEKLGFFCQFTVNGPVNPELQPGILHRMNLWIGAPGTGQELFSKAAAERTGCRFLKLSARDAVLGIGCRKGTGKAEIEALACGILSEAGLGIESVRAVATIDLKKEEKGILDFAEAYGLETIFFTAEELEQVPGSFSESEFVKQVTGTGSVCERAAMAASGWERSALAVRKKTARGVTAALAVRKRVIQMEWGQDRQ